MLTKDQWHQDPEAWHREAVGRRVVEALKANGFDAVYFSGRDEAADYILQFCGPGKDVAFGGSATVTRDMGMMDKVRATGSNVIENAYGDPAVIFEARRRQLLSDVFMCSTNALTLDGWLVNIDGIGNRTGAMMFGPRKVIVAAGVNKICPDLDAAWERLKFIACPINNQRLGGANPCTKTGYCVDCHLESRSCRIYTVLKRRPNLTDMTVVVIGETLGY